MGLWGVKIEATVAGELGACGYDWGFSVVGWFASNVEAWVSDVVGCKVGLGLLLGNGAESSRGVLPRLIVGKFGRSVWTVWGGVGGCGVACSLVVVLKIVSIVSMVLKLLFSLIVSFFARGKWRLTVSNDEWLLVVMLAVGDGARVWVFVCEIGRILAIGGREGHRQTGSAHVGWWRMHDCVCWARGG